MHQRIIISIFFLLAAATRLIAGERIVLVAGGGDKTVFPEAATQIQLREPFGVAFDRQGGMLILEMAKGSRLLRMEPDGKVIHLAGTGQIGFGGDGGPLAQAQFNGPHSLVTLPDGNVLVGDTWNGRVRRLDVAADKVSTQPGFVVPADKARSSGPYCIALDDSASQLYVADLRQIHLLDLKTGKSRVIAGNGQKGVPPDGARATEAPLADPRAVAADREGNVYVLERGGHALRVVDRNGTIRTVVNASGKKGATGDGGPARQATLNGPKHLCVDGDGNVIIADAENHLVRKYVPATGKIERVAGTGRPGKAGLGGPPQEAELARPHGVAIGPDGLLYIVDSYNDRILKVARR